MIRLSDLPEPLHTALLQAIPKGFKSPSVTWGEILYKFSAGDIRTLLQDLLPYSSLATSLPEIRRLQRDFKERADKGIRAEVVHILKTPCEDGPEYVRKLSAAVKHCGITSHFLTRWVLQMAYNEESRIVFDLETVTVSDLMYVLAESAILQVNCNHQIYPQHAVGVCAIFNALTREYIHWSLGGVPIKLLEQGQEISHHQITQAQAKLHDMLLAMTKDDAYFIKEIGTNGSRLYDTYWFENDEARVRKLRLLSQCLRVLANDALT